MLNGCLAASSSSAERSKFWMMMMRSSAAAADHPAHRPAPQHVPLGPAHNSLTRWVKPCVCVMCVWSPLHFLSDCDLAVKMKIWMQVDWQFDLTLLTGIFKSDFSEKNAFQARWKSFGHALKSKKNEKWLKMNENNKKSLIIMIIIDDLLPFDRLVQSDFTVDFLICWKIIQKSLRNTTELKVRIDCEQYWLEAKWLETIWMIGVNDMRSQLWHTLKNFLSHQLFRLSGWLCDDCKMATMMTWW